nr:hypothetical protein [Tanacetum cinerariifolium]
MKVRLKPRRILKGHLGTKTQGEINHPLIWNHPTVTDPSSTGAKYQIDQTQSTRLRYKSLTKNEGEPSYEGEPDAQPLHEEAAVHYANLKDSIDEYYDENITYKDHTNMLVEASMSSLDKSSNEISDLYKGLNIITKLLKESNNVVKDDPVVNKKISEATETFTTISTNIIEADLDKEEQIKKAEEEARLLVINKPEKMHEELGIPSALPAPIPEQASSKSSRRKRKHMELEQEIKIHGLEYNRTLPENIPFVNNMVIEEPEYGIFFTDEFGDQAFQRWSDINKVGMEAIVSYLVATSMVQSPENARFSMKLKKLIIEHPDQEKLKSKKVKLEALRYEMD